MANEITDEDKLIERLEVHRELVGWIIQELERKGIKAERTTKNNSKGDIRIDGHSDLTRLQNVLLQIKERFNQVEPREKRTQKVKSQTEEDLYIEVKAYKATNIGSSIAKKIIAKETIVGVVTTAKIYKPAKELFAQENIIWLENFPEELVKKSSKRE